MQNQELLTLEYLFRQFSHKTYGENCTQLQHAVSCAVIAEQQQLPEAMVVCAFLHDIGHFVADAKQYTALDKWGYAQHDQLGAEFLRGQGFGDEITQPIALHVQAKRYLQSQGKGSALSAASEQTLLQQGGVMSMSEVLAFEASPWFQQALTLRALDDAGKPGSMPQIDLDYWLQRVDSYH